MFAISALATAIPLLGLVASPEAPMDAEPEPAPQGHISDVDTESGDKATALATSEANTSSWAASAQASESATQSKAPKRSRLTLGLSAGPGAWGPNIGISWNDTTHLSVSYGALPLYDASVLHHGGIRLSHDLKTYRRAEAYAVANLSALYDTDDRGGEGVATIPFFSLGLGVKGPGTHEGGAQPFVELKVAPVGLLLGATISTYDAGVIALFGIRPTAGVTWTF